MILLLLTVLVLGSSRLVSGIHCTFCNAPTTVTRTVTIPETKWVTVTSSAAYISELEPHETLQPSSDVHNIMITILLLVVMGMVLLLLIMGGMAWMICLVKGKRSAMCGKADKQCKTGTNCIHNDTPF